MKINNLGYHFQHESTFVTNRPNGSGDYVLLIIPTESFFVLNGERRIAEPNSVVVYRKGTPQLYGASGGIFINHWIHFDLSEEELCDFETYGIPFDQILSLKDITVFAQFIKKMYIEKYSINEHKEESLLLYFRLLFIKLSEQLQSSITSRSYPYYDKMSHIRSKIYRNPGEKRSIASLSQEVMLSESYFEHLYKQIFGVSVMSDVITARIEYGKYLLANTDSSICDVATQCGYLNDIHFMRQFKSTEGITPSQYRKQFRTNPAESATGRSRNSYVIPQPKKDSTNH